MRKFNKEELLDAMQRTLVEYKNKCHEINFNDCALCKIFYSVYECRNCPMTVFVCDPDFFPCMFRRCRPIDSNPNEDKYRKKERLQAVQEFYERMIEKVQSMSTEELQEKHAFKFLVDLDNEIADKYKLYVRKKSKYSK